MIKTAITAALVLGSVSFAMASEFDANQQNRYPQANTQVFQSRNVALTGATTANRSESYIDRASQSYGGGY